MMTAYCNSSIPTTSGGWRLWGQAVPITFFTKISPLVLNLSTQEDVTNTAAIKEKIAPLFEAYRKMYADYYNNCKHPNSPAMRDANPVIILYPGVGMFHLPKTNKQQKVASRILYQCHQCNAGAEAVLNTLHYQDRKHST